MTKRFMYLRFHLKLKCMPQAQHEYNVQLSQTSESLEAESAWMICQIWNMYSIPIITITKGKETMLQFMIETIKLHA